MVESRLRIGNCSQYLDVTLYPKPKNRMPNESNILLLGEHLFLERLCFEWRGSQSQEPCNQMNFGTYKDIFDVVHDLQYIEEDCTNFDKHHG